MNNKEHSTEASSAAGAYKTNDLKSGATALVGAGLATYAFRLSNITIGKRFPALRVPIEEVGSGFVFGGALMLLYERISKKTRSL